MPPRSKSKRGVAHTTRANGVSVCVDKKAWPAASPTRGPSPPAKCLRLAVRRGAKGLGLAVNASNKVAEIAADGQAEVDGLLELGDEVISIDGIELAGRPMGDVIPRGAEKYDFVVSRSDVALAASMGRLPEDHPVNVAGKGTLRLLQLTVVRDANGLGLDMSGLNMLKKVVPGGAADKCGGWLAGDLVVAVNREKLGTKRLVNLLPRGLPEYTFTILRAEAVENANDPVEIPPPPPKTDATKAPPVRVASEEAAQPASTPAEDEPQSPPLEAAGHDGSIDELIERQASADEPEWLTAAASAAAAPVPPQEPRRPQPKEEGEPTDTELLDFLLWRDGRSRVGLLAIYKSWQEEEVIRRRRMLEAGEDPDVDVPASQYGAFFRSCIHVPAPLERLVAICWWFQDAITHLPLNLPHSQGTKATTRRYAIRMPSSKHLRMTH